MTLREPTRTRPRGSTAGAARSPFLRRRRAKRRQLWWRLLLGVAVAAALAGIVWLVFFSSALAVKGAQVRGLHVLSTGDVEEAAAVPLGVPLATADLAAVEARVEQLAAVQSADVSRAWPDRIRIDVTEREPVAVVSWEGSWRGVDRDGVLFRRYPSRPDGLPLVTMKASTTVEALAEAAAVVESLPTELLRRVRVIDVVSVDSIIFTLKRGALVRWGSAELSEDKAAVLALLLERKAQVYDVTAPGRPTISG